MTTTAPPSGTPEWVPLAEIWSRIKNVYGVAPTPEGWDALIRLVQNRNPQMRHRICDWQGEDPRRLPRGLRLETSTPGGNIVVEDWEAVDADWENYTIGSKTKRMPIFVRWHHVCLFAGVRVPGWRRSALSGMQIAAASSGKAEQGLPAEARKRGGLDYREADALLVVKMRELIRANKARSPEDAARALLKTDTVEGRGSDSSKITRLSKHFRETGAAQS